MTVNFRQKKGLNRLVESELVSQCLTLVELVCVTISTQFVSFCYNIPNFSFFFFMYWLCKILDTKLSGYIKNHKLDKFDRRYTPYISPSNRSLIYMMLFWYFSVKFCKIEIVVHCTKYKEINVYYCEGIGWVIWFEERRSKNRNNIAI